MAGGIGGNNLNEWEHCVAEGLLVDSVTAHLQVRVPQMIMAPVGTPFKSV